MRRLAVGALAGLLTACGAPRDASADVPVDSTLVDVLADVHLADARAALTPDSTRRDALADSLRKVALDAHELDDARFDAHLRALAADPAVAVATYDAVAARLDAARLPSPREGARGGGGGGRRPAQ